MLEFIAHVLTWMGLDALAAKVPDHVAAVIMALCVLGIVVIAVAMAVF